MAALNTPITLTEEAPSGFIRERWVFSLVGIHLVLDRYYYERKWAKKQPFKVVKFYDRHRDPEDGDYGDWEWVTEDEVPWDEELTVQVRSELMSRVKVVRQSEL